MTYIKQKHTDWQLRPSKRNEPFSILAKSPISNETQTLWLWLLGEQIWTPGTGPRPVCATLPHCHTKSTNRFGTRQTWPMAGRGEKTGRRSISGNGTSWIATVEPTGDQAILATDTSHRRVERPRKIRRERKKRSTVVSGPWPLSVPLKCHLASLPRINNSIWGLDDLKIYFFAMASVLC
jgi:hypothetical protein